MKTLNLVVNQDDVIFGYGEHDESAFNNYKEYLKSCNCNEELEKLKDIKYYELNLVDHGVKIVYANVDIDNIKNIDAYTEWELF